VTDLVGLALLMAAVTYPSRALFLLLPGAHSLPAPVRRYLRLIGPAVLAALSAVGVAIKETSGSSAALMIGPEWLAVGLCLVLVAWRKNLLLGLVAASVTAAGLRALGVGAVVL
jgi:branched-subunit amino acid transport protein